MSIEDRLQVVKLAEVDCEASRVRAQDSLAKLRKEAGDAATPWRIVTVGAVSGFLMGRRDPRRAPSLGGKLFASLAQTIITGLGASAASGVAAASAADAAAEATVKATTEAVNPNAVVVEVDP